MSQNIKDILKFFAWYVFSIFLTWQTFTFFGEIYQSLVHSRTSFFWGNGLEVFAGIPIAYCFYVFLGTSILIPKISKWVYVAMLSPVFL